MTKYELYWAEREQENLLENLMDTDILAAMVADVNNKAYQEAQEQLYAWYGKYADANGITIEEARKAAEEADIKALAKRAKTYVATKDLSPEANAAMAEYNFAMKTSRLELLQNQIRWSYFEATDQQEKILKDLLPKAAVKTLTRQAGIMGKTLYTPAETRRLADYITKTSYQGNTFSERIWTNNQNLMKGELDRILRQGIMQGKNPAAQATALAKLHQRKQSDAERLLRTEGARVRAQARAASFERAGYTHFKWVPRGNPCEYCLEKVKESEEKPYPIKGGLMPPLHPYCYCSTAPVEPEENILSKDAIDAEFEKQWQKALDGDSDARAHFEKLYQNTSTPDWKQFKLEDAAAAAKAAKKPATPPAAEAGARIRTPENTPITMSAIKQRVLATEMEYADASPEQMEAIENHFKKMIENSAYAMRVPDESILETILNDGRFKNQMETASSRGLYDPSVRKKATKKLFGLDDKTVKNMKPAEFEKYGFFTSRDPQEKNPEGIYPRAKQYGDVLIRFKREQVEDFATFTHEDSLGITNGCPVPTKKPSIAALDLWFDTEDELSQTINDTLERIDKSLKLTGGKYNPEVIAQNTRSSYIELQYHGELKTDYIESVSVRAGQLSPKMIKRLKDSGVEVYVDYKKV